MSKRLKRAPPYYDDPGCKYIVIADPWPGNKSGKERGEVYWNLLAAWVRFMLNKECEVDCIYAVNTVRRARMSFSCNPCVDGALICRSARTASRGAT